MSSIFALGLAAAGEAPLRQAKQGVPLVEIEINERGPFTMVLDTAAGLTTVTTSLKDELKLVNVGELPQPIHLATGAEAIDVYTLGAVSLAGETVPAPVTVVLDAPLKLLPEARGIVGMNVLTPYAVDIDQLNGRLTLHPAGTLPQNAKAMSVVPVEKRDDGFLIVSMVIDGVTARALVDTGANRTVFNPVLAKKLGIVAGAKGVTKSEIASAKSKTLKGEVETMTLGEAVWHDVEVQAADLPLFAPLGLDKTPSLILGNNVLKDVRLFIDYKGKQVYLSRPAGRQSRR